MREHKPVETDKEYGFEGHSDEETPAKEILAKDLAKIEVVQTTVPQ